MVYPRVSLFPGENRYSPKNCPGLSRITRPSPGHPPRYRKRTTGRPLEPAGSPASGNLQKPVCAGLPAGVPPSKEKPPLVGVSRAGDGTRTHDLLLGKELLGESIMSASYIWWFIVQNNAAYGGLSVYSVYIFHVVIENYPRLPTT